MTESQIETIPAEESVADEVPAGRRGQRAAEVSAGLGTRIRALRLQQGLSLRAVAGVAQISPSLLSQIERGEASPSLVSLVAIADALVVRPGVLLDDEADGDDDDSLVIRRTERLVIDDEMCRREYMMHLDDPYLDVAELAVAPGGESRPQQAKHSGRDYGLVITGQIVVEIEDQEETLRRGDYIAFDADRPHRIVNRSSRPARVLWIIAHDRSDVGAVRRANLRSA
jgi:transcriptional regulator with XRE-family HTH domain